MVAKSYSSLQCQIKTKKRSKWKENKGSDDVVKLVLLHIIAMRVHTNNGSNHNYIHRFEIEVGAGLDN